MVNLFYLDKNPKLCSQYYCDKHVNKIMIEILQILSQIHHNIGDSEPPYKKCMAIKPNLAPYVWAMKSKSNYKYCADLAYYLLQEYKFRYQKNEHKCEKAIEWLSHNIPKSIVGVRRTRFILTDNVSAYQEYFSDVEASRYVYVDFKCKNDKWSIRQEPKWFSVYLKKSNLERGKLIEKIMINVKEKLPDLSKKHNLKVRRFHSFLRICYDNMFNDKWDRKIKNYTNMFNTSKPLIHQLGYGHLLKVLEISNLIFNLKILENLNNNSLKYRNKLS